MPNWMSAAQITARYAVSEGRLLEYSFRGNLPLSRQPDGSVLFDEQEVAQLFPLRGGAMHAMPAPSVPCWGQLGTLRLGDEPNAHSQVATLSPREQRRRALRLRDGRHAEPLAPRRTGTG